MNQMFVIDIYLNKFKNHFCSINPRFFRYFACGLNGYVGMIDFNSHQWIKYGFVAFAVAIALASLLFSNKLVRELTIEERNKIEIWAKATEHLATETDNSDMNLVLRILQGNTTIPVILYDKSNRSFIVNNIKLPEGRDRFLQKKMEAFSKKRNAIELTELNQSLYYDDSYTLKQLQVFPYVQLAVIAFFIALVFFALRNSLKAQQNRVWVGLSKETAHQLGTPISSLVAWIEFLKLKDIDPALLSEIDKDVHRLEMIARRFSKIGSATDLRQADLREVVRRSLGYMEKRISDSAGSKVKYNATIEMSKGYVSGVCIMANDGSVIKGSLFNEFGISAIDFTYQPDKKKVKLLSVIKILNKWYIKKVLRKDLVQVMENLSKGIYSYHDKKFKIDYNFSLLKDATEE